MMSAQRVGIASVASTFLLIAATAAAAQVAIPPRGAVPRDTVREQRLLRQVTVAEGFEGRIFAGPPVAMYPTCLTTAADGAVFVCVDPNLSLDAVKGRGRVVRLVDTNRDGHADQYTVFTELDSPRGLIADGNSLIVMQPPDLVKYTDVNGDGISDTSTVLVRGLGFDLDFRGADHSTNGITLGIDGWIYIAVGDYGYLQATGADGRVIKHHGGSVVRVRMDGTGLEKFATGTRNIYDVAVDPLLHVFTRDNTNDGDGWDTRLHYLAPMANMGYPMLYRNFSDEHMPSLADYGAGSGTGALWVHDAGYPAGWNNTLYTGDWTVNKVFAQPLRPNGASFTVEQKELLSIPHPSDMAMDGRSHMYVSSLFAGTFTYQGDSVGYVLRVGSMGGTPATAPQIGSLSEAQLADAVVSQNAEQRLWAQRELLRRGARARAVLPQLERHLFNSQLTAESRVAAMFTVAQLAGSGARAALVRAAADPVLEPLALRALSDVATSSAPVDAALFGRALTEGKSAATYVEAMFGLVRHAGSSAAARRAVLTYAPVILGHAASDDPALAHLAVNALVSLGATEAALRALDAGSATERRAALRALQQMHSVDVVSALSRSYGQAAAAEARTDILGAIARLYHQEKPWEGGWWGTRPFYAGPYFEAVTWEGSSAAQQTLRDALLSRSGAGQAESLTSTVQMYVRNRVLPAGSMPLLLATVAAGHARSADVVDALLGSATLDARALGILTTLDAESPALHAAVAQLLAEETSLSAEFVPLLKAAALDETMEPAVRAPLVTSITRMPGPDGMRLATEVLARLIPRAGLDENLETAWRRFAGQRRNAQDLGFFIDLTRSSDSAQRIVAFAVLVQSVRGNRVQQNVRTRVTPVLDSTWADRPRAADLVSAIMIMGLEQQYDEQIRAFRGQPPAAEWLQLFNGTDLTDWDIKFAGHPLNENFNNTFRVQSGMLTVDYSAWTGFNGEFGHIFYKQPFSHYIVAVEYRFIGEQVTGAGSRNSWAIRNNGVMLHSQSAESMGVDQDFPISLELQLLGGLGSGRRTTANLCTPGTHVVRNDRLTTTHCMNSTSETYDGDQWVRVEALVLGDSIIRHIVNGDTVLTYSKPQMGGGSANNPKPGVLVEGKPLTEGYIVLQAETAPIEFRKVELLNLKGCMDRSSPKYREYYVISDPGACGTH